MHDDVQYASINLMGTFIKFFIALVAIFIIGGLGYRFYRVSKGDIKYEIIVPSYGRTQPATYFTKKYVEQNGCIIFKDEFGFEHKVCGAYEIQNW